MTYHIRSWLAIAIGTAASACALAILLQDAIRTGVTTIEHALIPGMVGIAIAAGHLVGDAARNRKMLSAAGFAVSFALASLLTVYTSVSKQADTTQLAVIQAEAGSKARRDKEADLAVARDRLRVAESMVAQEMTGQTCRARCQDWKTRAAEVQARIEKIEAELAAMAPARPLAAGADRMAGIIAIFTAYDVARVRAVLLLLEPFAKALLFELTAIVAFGYGFGRAKPRTVADRATVAGHATVASSETVARAGTISARTTVASATPVSSAATVSASLKRSPDPDNRPLSKSAALADLLILLATKQPIESQDWLRARWRVASKGTVSKWLADWERDGHVSRRTIGRCKIAERV